MRFDIYRPIHKALRLSLCRLLVKLGSTDFSDDAAASAVLDELRQQLALSSSHLSYEDQFIHPALEERASGASEAIEADHVHHEERLHQLEELASTLETAAKSERPALAHALYLAFARFVAEDFAHMQEEETVTLARLHALFSDEELLEIEGRIVSAHAPEKLMSSLRLMIPAMNPQERVMFLRNVQAKAPAEAFDAILNFAAKPALEVREWEHLVSNLRLAA